MNEFMTSLGQGLTGTNLLTLKEAENSTYRSLETLVGPSPYVIYFRAREWTLHSHRAKPAPSRKRNSSPSQTATAVYFA